MYLTPSIKKYLHTHLHNTIILHIITSYAYSMCIMYILFSFRSFISHYRLMYSYLPKYCPECIIISNYLSIYEKK